MSPPAAGLDAPSMRHWLLDQVCPYWSARVVDPRGGFFEGLDSRGRVVASPVRNILVQARLTYVFSHAAFISGSPQMKAAADHGFAQMQRWSHSPANGWARSRSTDHATVDAARDAYDHAFVILAAAWYFRATGNPAAVAMGEQAHAFAQTQLADTQHGGFFEEHPQVDRLPRRQNPQMHLLEATLAMHAATGEARWMDASRQLVRLFEQRLFDGASGSLGEFFGRDWSVPDGADSASREPGHHFEWVWLLAEYVRAGGEPQVTALSDRLFDFGSRFGRDPSGPLAGVMFDSVDPQGRVTADTKLLWPQTEYIKACVARAERGIAGMREEAEAHLTRLRTHFFRADGANWCNQLSRHGKCLSDVTPARVLYHLFLAVAEVLRLKDGTGAHA
ncbi:MAG: AGE family epimerase/isomerase [Rhizobacter sp.]